MERARDRGKIIITKSKDSYKKRRDSRQTLGTINTAIQARQIVLAR